MFVVKQENISVSNTTNAYGCYWRRIMDMDTYRVPGGWGARNHALRIAVTGKTQDDALQALRRSEERAKRLLVAAYEQDPKRVPAS
jgi:hypothetical protein